MGECKQVVFTNIRKLDTSLDEILNDEYWEMGFIFPEKPSQKNAHAIPFHIILIVPQIGKFILINHKIPDKKIFNVV